MMSGHMANNKLILTQSEYEHLLEEIKKLQARITELTALRDDLVYHICPALKAEYDEKIVSLERELMAANLYLRQMQRTVEILQAQLNRRQRPSMDEAEAQAKQESKEYEEDLHRRAEEARESRQKWEESQWAKYDRQERENKENESREGKNKDGEHIDSIQGEKTGSGNRGGTGQDKIGDSEENAGSKNTSGDAGAEEKSTAKEETPAQKIKRLYRQIVKRLHPDVHPNPTEREKELLNRAMKAFKEGNLRELEQIWDELSGMDSPEDAFSDTPEGREKLRELLAKLKVRVQLLETEIDHIKADFPYKLKSFLENPEAVKEARSKIQEKLDHVREMNRKLEEYINELREKMK